MKNDLAELIQKEENTVIKNIFENVIHEQISPTLEKSPVNWEKKLEALSLHDTLSREDVDFILKHESQIRQNPEKQPLIQKAKEWITSRSEHRVFVAATNVKASDTFNSIHRVVTSNRPLPAPEDNSTNEVRIFEGKILKRTGELENPPGIVSKKMKKKRSGEQTKLFYNLMGFKTSHLGNLNLKNSSLKRLGMEWTDKDTQRRMFDPRNYSSEDVNPVKREISASSSLFYTKIIDGLSNEYADKFKKWMEHVASKKDDQNAPPEIYLVPDLDSEENKKQYAACEKAQWKYTSVNAQTMKQETHFISFKDMQILYLTGVPRTQFTLANPEKHPEITNVLLRDMLEIDWKVISPEFLNASALRNVQIQPVVEDMHILFNLMNSGGIDKVLNNLTAKAEMEAIITGELQPMDMHANNIGLRQLKSPNMPSFKEISFSNGWRDISGWKRLQELYLAGALRDDLDIKIDGVTSKFSDLPWIKEALEQPWEFVFFDTDLSFGEDNELQTYSYQGDFGHNIPFRSGLLMNRWKDQPLRDDVVKRLLNAGEQNKKMRDYLRKADAPIRQRLSPEGLKKVDEALKPVLEKYQFYPGTDKIDAETHEDLAKKFSENISDLSTNKDFWNLLQSELPKKMKYKLTEDTAESLEQRKALATQLFPKGTIKQQNALIERQDHQIAYLEAYQALKGESDVTQRKEKIINFINLSAAPMDTLTREQIRQMIGKATEESEINLIYAALIKTYKPTYFNVMCSMYPNLADYFKLLSINGNLPSAGSKIGAHNQTMEEQISIVENRFSPDRDEHKLALILENRIRQKKEIPSFQH